MLQDKQAKEEEKQKERRWACLHRLKKKGVAFVAGGGVKRGSAGLSRSTRRDVTWPNRRSDLRLGKYPLYHPGGTACVLLLRRDVASGIAEGLTGRQPVTSHVG
jgi:hypothetical protein